MMNDIKKMNRNIYILGIAILAAACNTTGKSEQSILEYMREQTGSVKLGIEFADVQITKQTVGDSINILQEKYEQELKEKVEKIELLDKSIKKAEEKIKSAEKGSMLSQIYSQELNYSKQQYKEWTEKVITNEKVRYDGRNRDEILATVVSCRMTSLINPVLNAKQTKEGRFLLTTDESKCIRQLK